MQRFAVVIFLIALLCLYSKNMCTLYIYDEKNTFKNTDSARSAPAMMVQSHRSKHSRLLLFSFVFSFAFRCLSFFLLWTNCWAKQFPINCFALLNPLKPMWCNCQRFFPLLYPIPYQLHAIIRFIFILSVHRAENTNDKNWIIKIWRSSHFICRQILYGWPNVMGIKKNTKKKYVWNVYIETSVLWE